MIHGFAVMLADVEEEVARTLWWEDGGEEQFQIVVVMKMMLVLYVVGGGNLDLKITMMVGGDPNFLRWARVDFWGGSMVEWLVT